ncbi:MAG: hypothetical protein OXH16_11485 [Gemmatimonadetes bacterium]|nr:hypothetical protein [Gemmatimonadota bacterium]
MRPSRWLSILLIGTALCALDLSDIYAQRGGGGRGGGGRGGGGGGRADLSPQQRRQFAEYPWDAQKLLEANAQIISQIPAPIRMYILDQAKKWDDLFPVRHQQLELFFRKLPNTDRREFNAVFGDILREFQALQGGRQGRQGQGARGGGQERQGQGVRGGGGGRRGQQGARGGGQGRQGQGARGGGGGRGGPSLNISDFTPAQYAMIERAFQSFVLSDQGLSKGVVIIAITGSGSGSNIPAYLTYRGALFNNIDYGKNSREWMTTVQTASPNAIKGKNLKVPSLFEHHNKAIEDKTHTRTLAFYQSGEKEIPPIVSKTKGYGTRYSPSAVNAPSLEKIAGIIEEQLGTAIKQGKSQRYIDRMVKPKLTPEALKLKKIIKDEAFGRLVSGILMDSEESRKLGSAFITQIAQKAMDAALPDIVFIEMKAGDVSVQTISQFHDTMSAMARYGSNVTFALFDEPAGQALIVSPKIIGGQSFDGQSLENISATLARASSLMLDGAAGTPVAEVRMR